MTRARAASAGVQPPPRLDAINTPLESVNLIEANAGTGKTWTITALYVRLLLEAERSVDSILVVTFTEAATAELRDRIRMRLADARAAFERGAAAPGDELMAALLVRIADLSQALLRLTGALRDFDQAPIYTIHGFCQRVLGDSAFESGMPFRTEILVDQTALLQEIVEDFWRTEMHAATPLFTRFLLWKGIDPDKLVKDLGGWVAKPYLHVRGPADAGDVTALERDYESAFTEARRLWLSGREDVQQQLIDNPDLSGSVYRAQRVQSWLEQMDQCLRPDRGSLDLGKHFEKFTQEKLQAGTRRGRVPPAHAFYAACSRLKRAHEALLAAYACRVPILKARLLDYSNVELAARKARQQLQSYDDLLLKVHETLHGDSGAALTAAVRERYQAALIDEFQDTDPIQYGIFQTIYGNSDLPVFFVGDPKQSIYSFRGADVYAYLTARSAARRTYTLDVNWRSEPSLLDAVNSIFENAPTPFIISDIPFQPSEAAVGDRGRFVIEGESDAPFQIWFADHDDPKPIAKAQIKEAAAKATAAEIARLLSLGVRGQARIIDTRTERPLRGGDIAVLVRSHDQARAVRDALASAGVASVQRGSQNVFESAEAAELERVLIAISEPAREPLIAAALATDLLGYSGEMLYALRTNESAWEDVVESFREAHREWRERGFVPMLRNFLHRYDVVYRLLQYNDGERRVTNLRHLAERLHCDADKHGIGGLLAWLAAKRTAPGYANIEELLRLESDDNLVKILTIHVAKGLEFPLVFCPFLWDGKLWAEEDAVLTFHDPATREAVLDFGSTTLEQSRAHAKAEERAENVRLLYVALTRARYRCWMVWGRINDAQTSAPAWLLHRTEQSRNAAGEVTGLLEETSGVSLANMRADLDRLQRSSRDAIAIVDLPDGSARFEPAGAASPRLAARAFTGAILDTKRVTSFTGLAHGRSIEAPDYDAADRAAELEPIAGSRDIFAFPRGAQAGKCLHAIFEHVDFTKLVRPELELLVGKQLLAHGFENVWAHTVADMVERVIATPLDAGGTLRLNRVPLSRRLDELEFYYPLASLSHAGLKQVLLAWSFPEEIRERIGELTFSTIQGYMRGFIDIVFEHDGRYYLADYKSNWLGPALEWYRPAALAKAMAREAYYLQYLVYCVALHRYLKLRVREYRYDSHFGGVRYLFVRGMRPQSGAACGVFADKPAQGLIEALDRYLATGRN